VTQRLIFWLFLLLAAGTASAQTGSGSKWLLHTLLTSENPNFVLMGAKAVARDQAAEQFTLDVAAEVLVQRANAHVSSGIDLDTSAWLMKGLGASENARYRSVIDNAIAAYSNEKITNFGNLSLAQFSKPSTDAYVAGTVSIEGLRASLNAVRSVPGSMPRTFAAIKPSDSVDSVIAALGYPDQLLETVESKGHAWAKLRVRSLQLQYYGLGLVDIDYHFAAGTGWAVSMVWLDVPNKAAPYSGTQLADASLIMTSEPMVLRKLAKRLASRHVTEAELLDRMAERIKISMDSKDEFEVDALKYFCRLLGASGDKKYVEALTWVAVRADNHNYILKQHAIAAREKLEALQGLN
jgi:hypothetical protein